MHISLHTAALLIPYFDWYSLHCTLFFAFSKLLLFLDVYSIYSRGKTKMTGCMYVHTFSLLFSLVLSAVGIYTFILRIGTSRVHGGNKKAFL